MSQLKNSPLLEAAVHHQVRSLTTMTFFSQTRQTCHLIFSMHLLILMSQVPINMDTYKDVHMEMYLEKYTLCFTL